MTAKDRFAEILRAVRVEADQRYALAELNEFLHSCVPGQFQAAVALGPSGELSAFARNYVAAMVEQAAGQKEVTPPAWVLSIDPLAEPYFATPWKFLRLHLLHASPVPFKRRNIFVDAAVGARV